MSNGKAPDGARFSPDVIYAARAGFIGKRGVAIFEDARIAVHCHGDCPFDERSKHPQSLLFVTGHRAGFVCSMMLRGLAPVLQAALCNGLTFDPFSLQQDCLAASEVNVGRG
jgi:hypothetical protein